MFLVIFSVFLRLFFASSFGGFVFLFFLFKNLRTIFRIPNRVRGCFTVNGLFSMLHPFNLWRFCSPGHLLRFQDPAYVWWRSHKNSKNTFFSVHFGQMLLQKKRRTGPAPPFFPGPCAHLLSYTPSAYGHTSALVYRRSNPLLHTLLTRPF